MPHTAYIFDPLQIAFPCKTRKIRCKSRLSGNWLTETGLHLAVSSATQSVSVGGKGARSGARCGLQLDGRHKGLERIVERVRQFAQIGHACSWPNTEGRPWLGHPGTCRSPAAMGFRAPKSIITPVAGAARLVAGDSRAMLALRATPRLTAHRVRA